jgi:hypothetical protein
MTGCRAGQSAVQRSVLVRAASNHGRRAPGLGSTRLGDQATRWREPGAPGVARPGARLLASDGMVHLCDTEALGGQAQAAD